MENVDFDSQFDSYGAFDDSMNEIVKDSIGVGDLSDDVYSEGTGILVYDTEEDEGTSILVHDTEEDGNALPSTVPCLARRKTAELTQKSTPTQRCGGGKTTTTKSDRDFDLNKLPIRGMFTSVYPEREEGCTEILRLLLPDFY